MNFVTKDSTTANSEKNCTNIRTTIPMTRTHKKYIKANFFADIRFITIPSLLLLN